MDLKLIVRKFGRILPISATVLLLFKVGLLSNRAFAIDEGKFDLSQKAENCQPVIHIKDNGKDKSIEVKEFATFENINGEPEKFKSAGYRWVKTNTLEKDVLTQTWERSDPDYRGVHQSDVPKKAVYKLAFKGGGKVETYSEETDDNNKVSKRHCDYQRSDKQD